MMAVLYLRLTSRRKEHCENVPHVIKKERHIGRMEFSSVYMFQNIVCTNPHHIVTVLYYEGDIYPFF
jgi:hypothetical protein